MATEYAAGSAILALFIAPIVAICIFPFLFPVIFLLNSIGVMGSSAITASGQGYYITIAIAFLISALMSTSQDSRFLSVVIEYGEYWLTASLAGYVAFSVSGGALMLIGSSDDFRAVSMLLMLTGFISAGLYSVISDRSVVQFLNDLVKEVG